MKDEVVSSMSPRKSQIAKPQKKSALGRLKKVSRRAVRRIRKIFTKRVRVEIDKTLLGNRYSGLKSIILNVDVVQWGTPVDMRLEIKIEGMEQHIFTKNFQALPRRNILRFYLNSHLLSNGAAQICIRAWAGNKLIKKHRQRIIVANQGGISEKVRESLESYNTPLVLEGHCDSRYYDYDDEAIQPWFNRADADKHIEKKLEAGLIAAPEANMLRHFVQNGFVILPNIIDENLIEEILDCLREAETSGWEGYVPGSSQRLHRLHMKYRPVRRLWRHPEIIRHLGHIFESAPRPCQTLTYIHGSEQRPHQDTIHLTPFPAGYMCGVWVALEDVQENSGELVVYPGTHRLMRLTMQNTGCQKIANNDWKEFDKLVADRWQSMIDESGIQPLYYRPKRGTVLIWHENLMHGGSVRIDKSLTRRSIVSHYFADGAIAYYDSTGEAGYMEDPVHA